MIATQQSLTLQKYKSYNRTIGVRISELSGYPVIIRKKVKKQNPNEKKTKLSLINIE